MLSDSDTEADVHTLTVNEHYAKAFQYKKEREELAKLKEKYGSDISSSASSVSDDSDDSEETEEDSDGNELTPAVDAAILRTLARIKRKDPVIYEDGRKVFEEEQGRTQDKALTRNRKLKGKSKPLTIRQAALNSALADSHSRSPSPQLKTTSLTHVEEQRLLESETRAAFNGAVPSTSKREIDDDSDSQDDFLVPRSRTRDELEIEEEAYRTFLEREVGEDLDGLVTVEKSNTREVVGVPGSVEDIVKSRGKEKKKRHEETQRDKEDLGLKGTKRKKAKEEDDQEFLMNYILNRGWIDRSNRRLPTYDEIVGSPSSSNSRKRSQANERKSGNDESEEDPDGDHDGLDGKDADGEAGVTLSDEDSFDDLADAFETSYNFRYEEPDAAVIAAHPRNLPTVRRESTTRKEARARKKARQEAEKRELLEARKGKVRREREEVEKAMAEVEALESNDALGMHTESLDKTEKQQKKEEIARLKDLKAKELRRKLERVGAEGDLAGIGEEALARLDLDAPWDPSKHDAQMAALYVDGSGDEGDDGNLEKPNWEDDINIDDIVPPLDAKSKPESKKQKKKEKKKFKKGHVSEDDEGVDVDAMDADVVGEDGGWNWDGEDDGEEWNGTEEERKRKVDAYMDEVVNRLGFNDITSHIPTRFHYTTTAPDNYGLSPAEILLATEAELNAYVGLKKMAPYRTQRGGKPGKTSWDPTRSQGLKEFRDKLRARIGSSHEGSWSLGNSGDRRNGKADGGEKKRRMGKKERAKLKAAAEDREGGGEDDQADVVKQSCALVQRSEADAGQRHKKRSRDSHSDHPPTKFHPRETDAEKARGSDVDDSEPKRKRRRQHKKRSEVSAAT
ncbi:Krr1-domain-containing protein [Phlebopus sp. FC_14]|nr:Krr1-domain-containing protein [Phlebopus sp. FC_14]